MSVNYYLLKGTEKIVGRIIRDDEGTIIKQSLKNNYTLDDVNEWSDLLYEDDGFTVNFVWDSDLLIHRLKGFAELLDEAKKAKTKELKKEAVKRMGLVNPAVTSYDVYLLLEAMFKSSRNSVVPAAREDVPVLDPILEKLRDIRIAGEAAKDAYSLYLVIDDVKNYDVVNTPSWPVI